MRAVAERGDAASEPPSALTPVSLLFWLRQLMMLSQF